MILFLNHGKVRPSLPLFLYIHFQAAETQHKLAYAKRKLLAHILRSSGSSASVTAWSRKSNDIIRTHIWFSYLSDLPSAVSSILSHVFHWLAMDEMAENVGPAWVTCLLGNDNDQENSWIGYTWVTCSPFKWKKFSSTYIIGTEHGKKALPQITSLCRSQKGIMDAEHEERGREGERGVGRERGRVGKGWRERERENEYHLLH